nr:hypothetical protein [Halomicroarcula sp. SYNS111]
MDAEGAGVVLRLDEGRLAVVVLADRVDVVEPLDRVAGIDTEAGPVDAVEARQFGRVVSKRAVPVDVDEAVAEPGERTGGRRCFAGKRLVEAALVFVEGGSQAH